MEKLALQINKKSIHYKKIHERVDLLEGANISFVKTRVCKVEDIDLELASELEIEFLRFFSLLYTKELAFIVPPPLVDKFWHSFILFTYDYKIFCEKYNNFFFHHLPAKNNDDLEKVRKEYSKTLDLISDLYPSYNKKVWIPTKDFS